MRILTLFKPKCNAAGSAPEAAQLCPSAHKGYGHRIRAARRLANGCRFRGTRAAQRLKYVMFQTLTPCRGIEDSPYPDHRGPGMSNDKGAALRRPLQPSQSRIRRQCRPQSGMERRAGGYLQHSSTLKKAAAPAPHTGQASQGPSWV